jgi:hypothetical protein
MRINGGDIAGIEEAIRIQNRFAFAAEVVAGNGRAAHFQAAKNLAIPGQIAAFIIGFFSTVLSFVVPLYSLQIFERVATTANDLDASSTNCKDISDRSNR